MCNEKFNEYEARVVSVITESLGIVPNSLKSRSDKLEI